MNLETAMLHRHMVRSYTDKPLPSEIVSDLESRIKMLNAELLTDIQLETNSNAVFNPLIRLILAKGVDNYFILASKGQPDMREKLGYAAADLMLYAQTLGLNTWYVGGTYSHKEAQKEAGGLNAIGVVAVGYGKTQGKSHQSKKPDEVAEYLSGEQPEWFKNGVKAALLAPTALNKQDFHITGNGNSVHIDYAPETFAGEDLGLVKYFFELGAGKSNFRWD